MEHLFAESISVKQSFLKGNKEEMIKVIGVMGKAIEGGYKILFFGNGGSAADAQHLAAEFVNRMLIERPPLPSIALTTDTSVLTSIANDYSYEDVFAKQIRALGKPGDIAFGLTTSGNSPNVNRALETANEMGLSTICLSGRDGGQAAKIAQYNLIVDQAKKTPRIQEVHITVGHILVEILDHLLYGRKK
ncbi:MAG: D-sedoheptulose 7-phosphate isomerase [Deltaproteobacteria bacterium]|nr:D-sedoheptulose 7-phosphate isomerase [Deltaproteobacteria bacterium]